MWGEDVCVWCWGWGGRGWRWGGWAEGLLLEKKEKAGEESGSTVINMLKAQPVRLRH